jgi:hypothetical protein
MTIAVLSSEYELTLPEEVCSALGLVVGHVLDAQIVGGCIQLVPQWRGDSPCVRDLDAPECNDDSAGETPTQPSPAGGGLHTDAAPGIAAT